MDTTRCECWWMLKTLAGLAVLLLGVMPRLPAVSIILPVVAAVHHACLLHACNSMLCTHHAPPVPPPAPPPCSYKWYRSFEAQHFPDPMGVRARLECWTLGLYPTGGLQ